MQSRNSATAPAQKPSVKPEQWAAGTDSLSAGSPIQPAAKAPTLAEQSFDQLAEMLTLGWSVKEQYIDQVKLTGQLAKAEWQLTERSLAIAAVLMVCFGAGIVLLWGCMLLLIGALLLELGCSIAITAAALLLLQLVLLFWCWHSFSYVLSQAGFRQTRQQLQRVFFSEKE